MRRKKILLVYAIVSLFIVLSTTVFGAFEMIRTISNSNVNVGNISLEDPIVSYWDSANGTYTQITAENPITGYSNGVLSTYATSKKETDTEGYIQLNQVGVTVAFKSDISVRLRVKIQDEWISRKVYNSGTIKTSIITKDWKSSADFVSPFSFAVSGSTELWDYDVTTGYAYYNGIIAGDTTGTTITKEFLVHNTYVYETSSTIIGYRETILVTLAFQIDLVQANRAEKVWGVTFE